MAHSVADMQVFFAGLLHEHDHTFSCKSTEQLSSLWAAFTKCKSNLRDGFRLENMSWRLWYREAMIRKRLESETAITLESSTTSETYTSNNNNNNNDTINNKQQTTRLVRTRSLPSLSCQVQHIMDSYKVTTPLKSTIDTMDTTTTSPRSPKFYIDQEDEDEEKEASDMDLLYYDHYFDDDDDDDTEFSDDSSEASSLDNSNMLIISTNPNNKPVSLLTNLLQKESSSAASTSSSSTQSIGGLRRSHCYGRLDQWFSAALS